MNTDARLAGRPAFTTRIAAADGPGAVAVRKAILIARDAIAARMAHTRSRTPGRRYVAENRYEDPTHLLSASIVHAPADHGWVEYACDAKRFEIRISSGQRRSRKPLVVVKERHPMGSAPTELDRDRIVARLDRWSSMFDSDDAAPNEGWSKAVNYVAALARENGGRDDAPLPHTLVLPSAYADGSILVDRKSRNAMKGVADVGLDLDLGAYGAISHAVSRMCHTSRMENAYVDHRGDVRIECDLSGDVRLKLTVPDPMTALRAFAEAAPYMPDGAPLAFAA